MLRASINVGNNGLNAITIGSIRNFATLKDISLRLKSVKNIQKITKSMKMVSAAKYAKAERDLRSARVFGEGAKAFFANVADEGAIVETKPKHLLVLLTSDRGLCGGVHTNIAKDAKKFIANKPEGVEVKIICIGDKSKAIMQRLHSSHILLSVNDIGRTPPTFDNASTIASSILNCGYDFEQGDIIFNRFKSVVSHQTTRLAIPMLREVQEKAKLSSYDSLDDDVLQSYVEYALATHIYYALKECATSEQSSRMTAMDGASKNAGELIGKLTMQFNRTRQAVITRELIEIISGAACV